MTAIRIFVARLRALFGGRAADDALRREMADHLDEATDDFIRQGLSPDEARRAALLRFGGVTQAEQLHRERRGFASLDRLRLDGRLTVRALRRTPGFTVTVVVVSALGIGAITAVFALLYAIVLRPLPFVQPEQLTLLTHTRQGPGRSLVGVSPGLAVHYQQSVPSIAAIALYRSASPNTVTLPNGDVTGVHVVVASHRLFEVLGTIPSRGRLFTADDGKPGFLDTSWAVPVLLDYGFWRDRLGSDESVVGRTLVFNSSTKRLVVGVLPEGFRFPDTTSDIWMLSEPPPHPSAALETFGWDALVRLRPGVSATTAQSEIARALPLVIGTYADATPVRMAALQLTPVLTPLKDAVGGDVPHLLWTLLGGMVCLLLIAGANVGALLGARVEERRPEIAVRLAIGAGPADVARLFTIEAAVIALAAGALGVVIAEGLVRGVLELTPVALPRASGIGVGPATVAFAGAVALILTLSYAALSRRTQRRAINGGLGTARMTPVRPRAGALRDPFTTVQVALGLALLIGSALMVQTYRHLMNRPLGFAASGLLTVEVTLPSSQAGRYATIYQAVADQVAEIPGAESVAAGSFMPLAGGAHMFPVAAGDRAVPIKFVTPGFFQVMKMPLVEGFGLGRDEPIAIDRPVIVSRALAERLFPGQSAVGQPIRRLDQDGTVPTKGNNVIPPPFTIAGVVGNVPELSLRSNDEEALYIPVIFPSVEPFIVPTDMTLVIRTSLTPDALAADVRRAVAAADPKMTVGRIRTMNAIVDAARGTEVFVGSLLLAAAAISLLLSVVGIYGSVTQVVRRRTREIGVRLALGARTSEVVALVAGGSMRAVLAGLIAGLVIAFLGTGTLRALLFGVAPRDPAAFAGATAVLLVSAVTAATLAGRRAAQISPTEALKE